MNIIWFKLKQESKRILGSLLGGYKPQHEETNNYVFCTTISAKVLRATECTILPTILPPVKNVRKKEKTHIRMYLLHNYSTIGFVILFILDRLAYYIVYWKDHVLVIQQKRHARCTSNWKPLFIDWFQQ